MKITKIEKVPSQKWVYDPVCGDPHTYIAAGIVNHNCVLWIDEVEKSLSGTKSSNFSDGGTLSRVFGTLLTQMQEGLDGVTIIATANDITALPPEFIRRFNEVFFVDLPGPEERWEIFDIHLRKRKREISAFKKHKDEILTASMNYTGAEIEKSIQNAIACAFYEGKIPLTKDHIVTALKETKPIFEVMSKKVKAIRDKAKKSYRFASQWAEDAANDSTVQTKKGEKLSFDETLEDFSNLKSRKSKEKSSPTKDTKYDGALE